MDLYEVPPACRSNIWQKHCSDRPCWFSNKTNSYRKSNTKQNRNSIGKPPSLLRLSSTGDSSEDSTEIRTFDPSNIQGSESNSAWDRVRPTCKPAVGVFDRFTKFAFSTNSTSRGLRQSSAMSLTKESSGMSGRLLDQNQGDLSFLMETFNHPKVEMERQGQNLHNNMPPVPGVHPQQGGMNGFVKEGIYHSFARNATHQVPAESQPVVQQAFRFLNIGPFYHQNHYHQHPHPYMTRNHFMPQQQSTMSSLQFQSGSLSSNPCVTSGTPRSHASAQIRDSAVLRNQLVDPRVRSQFINTESIAARIQAHAIVNNPEENKQCHHKFHSSRNHMVKIRKLSHTQQNQNPNKSTGCTHQGSSNQVHRSPPCAKNTVSKQNNSPHKSVKRQPEIKCSLKTKQKHQDVETLDLHTASCKQLQELKEFAKKSDPLDSMTKEVQEEGTDQSGQMSEIWQMDHKLDDHIVHHRSNSTSSVDILHRGTDHCETAEAKTKTSTRAKSEDNKTWVTMVTTSHPVSTVDDDNEKSHLPDSQIRPASVDAEFIQNDCSKETCQLTPEDGSSEGEQKHENVEGGLSPSNAPVGTPQQHTETVSTHQPQFKSLSSKSELASSPGSKPLHSSLAFLLSETASNDSDFSDSDWDASSTDKSPSSDTWDFLKCFDDPYNPLYGWKCSRSTNQQQGKEQDTETSKLDSSLGDDELDSGISSLQAPQDETEEVGADDSESWDEDGCGEEDSAGELCQLWKSFCSSDPFNPLNGWRCDTLHDTCVTENTATPRKRLNNTESPVQLEDEPAQSDSFPESKELHSSAFETSKCMTNFAPQSEPAKLHPSVLYILGVNDSDDDSDDDYDDFDDYAADKYDKEWDSFQTSSDPYNPMQGWKAHSVTSEKLEALNASYNRLVSQDENSAMNSGDGSLNTRLFNTTPSCALRRKSATETPSLTVANPSMKRTSSTGCLWIPSDSEGTGPARPFHNKKVHFCEASPTIISFEVPTWSSEYCASRKGPWQEMARDRCRFMHRIRSTEAQIAHVFTPDHRLKVQQRIKL